MKEGECMKKILFIVFLLFVFSMYGCKPKENENVNNKVVVLSVGFMLAKVIEAITCNQPVSAVYDLFNRE